MYQYEFNVYQHGDCMSVICSGADFFCAELACSEMYPDAEYVERVGRVND